MVKFDDRSNGDYKILENHIVKMIHPPGHRKSITPPRPSTGQQGTFSQSCLPSHASPRSSPERGHDNADQWQTMSSPGPSQTIYYNNYFGNNPSHNGTQAEDSKRFDNQRRAGRPPAGYNTYEELHDAQMDTQMRPSTRQTTFPHGTLDLRHPSSHSVGQLSAELDGLSFANGRSEPNIPRRSTVPHASNVNDDEDPFNRLIMFDTVLIVDDTGSMIKAARDSEPEGADRWSTTGEALKHIAQLAASKDPDGIDIKFLKSQSLNEDNITSVDTVMEILGLIDMYDGTHGGGTVFKEHLENAISPRLEFYRDYLQQEAAYKEDLRRLAKDRQARARLERPKRPNMLNLIIITDGQADDRQEVEDYIVETAVELDRLRAPAAQVGIQFVQVGQDESARRYLKHLDDELKHREPPIRDVSSYPICH